MVVMMLLLLLSGEHRGDGADDGRERSRALCSLLPPTACPGSLGVARCVYENGAYRA